MQTQILKSFASTLLFFTNQIHTQEPPSPQEHPKQPEKKRQRYTPLDNCDPKIWDTFFTQMEQMALGYSNHVDFDGDFVHDSECVLGGLIGNLFAAYSEILDENEETNAWLRIFGVDWYQASTTFSKWYL